MSFSALAISVASLCMLLPAGVAVAEQARLFGDTRVGIFASERQARDQEVTKEEALRMRVRVGVEAPLTSDWQFRGRLAGRFSTDQDRSRFWLRGWAPTRGGLDDGDATLDELFLRYAPADADWALRIGRFQTSYKLTGVASKSLDRNDSSNIRVTWTDGLHWQYAWTPHWRSHLVLQNNHSSGSSQLARAPLTFDDSSSRISALAALEATRPWGPLTQRLFAVTWMPQSLATDGIGAARRDDYWTATAKLFAEWPIGKHGMRGGIGGEAGYAPNTPAKSVVGAGTGQSADGLARQFSMSTWDFIPGHHLAFVFGRAGAGWLASTDFRNNDRLLEVRYQWRFSPTWSLETRLRRRTEIELPENTPRARIDDDFYFRFTARF